jgi:hypothetical protein
MGDVAMVINIEVTKTVEKIDTPLQTIAKNYSAFCIDNNAHVKHVVIVLTAAVLIHQKVRIVSRCFFCKSLVALHCRFEMDAFLVLPFISHSAPNPLFQ